MLQGLLYGVSADDPQVFAIVAGFLVFVALVASYVPAHRAARIAPVTALRST
jgi:ABC-type lipoprotein release transport system permease subunit